MKGMLLLIVLVSTFYFSYSQSVTMTSGYADGTFTKGKKVYILANPCPAGTVFNKWTGNTPVADSFSISTSFTMPATNVRLTANYKTAPVWSPVITTINGSNAEYYFPSGKIKGLITFYHGSGGSASNWFLDEFSKLFVNYAVEEGYGVFATESKDRGNKVWDMSGAGSVDVQNMSVMFSTLKSEGLITNSTPIFGVGMSDGSMFCSMIAALDDFSANALYCVPGSNQYIKTTNSPTEWCISNDDTTMIPNMMSQAQSNYQVLQGRGIDAQFLIHYATPVFPTLFMQQQSFDSSSSETVYEGLKTGGALNNQDFMIVDPMQEKLWRFDIDNSFKSKLNYIQGELTAAAAEHKFHNYFEYETIQFFGKHLKTKPTVLQGLMPTGSDNALSIYPNPAANFFNFRSATNISTIAVFNIAGELVKQFSPNSTSGQLSSAGLANGIYSVRLTDKSGKISSNKIVINNN